MRPFALAAALVLGCGTIARGDGGDDNLPTREIPLFELVDVPPEECDLLEEVEAQDDCDKLPFIFTEDRQFFQTPFAIVEGDIVALYFTNRVERVFVISRAESTDGVTFGEPQVVLSRELEWEGGLNSPSVLVQGGTTYIWYIGNSGELGLAQTTDGTNYTRQAEPILVPPEGEEYRSPRVVFFDGKFVMFFQHTINTEVTNADGDIEVQSSHTLARAESPDGINWTLVGDVMTGADGCIGTSGDPETCWDGDGVGAASVRVTTSNLGRRILDIWYTGYRGEGSDIGFAASFDGRSFSRFELNPLLVDVTDAAAPTVVEFQGTYFLYYNATRDRFPAIAVARQRVAE